MHHIMRHNIYTPYIYMKLGDTDWTGPGPIIISAILLIGLDQVKTWAWRIQIFWGTSSGNPGLIYITIYHLAEAGAIPASQALVKSRTSC